MPFVFLAMKTQGGLELSTHARLEIEEDIGFQQREWKVQRASWLFFFLVTLAAVLGLFGRGLLSEAAVGDDRLSMRYQRFERVQRPTTIRLRISSKAGKTAGVVIERHYVDAARIERITPEPAKAEASTHGITYYFPIMDDPVIVTFHLELERFGLVPGGIGLSDGPLLSFKQFVYP